MEAGRQAIAVPVPEEKIGAFCRRWKVAELAVFGSVLRADFGPDSDVDVLVRFEDEAPWSLLDLVQMRDELGSIWGRAVDLVEGKALRNPFRRKAILGSRHIVYESD